MNKVIIVSPHFPPSNLAAVHRARLFAKHLPNFGWEPIILTVHNNHYEEALDWNLYKLISSQLKVETVKALPTGPVRVIGDIGLRGFPYLFKKLLSIVHKEQPKFIYLTIPSFYAALLGRAINEITGVPYGIDYIDPWVHTFAGSERKFSRHWWSTKLAGVLEPIAIKKASLITGVAEGYYMPVFERNPHLKKTALHVAMPYGGEAEDHKVLNKLGLRPYLFERKSDKFQFVYAGAMLPKAYNVLEQMFKFLLRDVKLLENIEFHFIGTGSRANDSNSYNIKPYAQKYNLWETVVFEYPKRIPYLDVLTHLSAADGVFILGSTEPHYTPSKVYQGVLSEKPLFAILHKDSTAAQVIRESNSGLVLAFNGEDDLFTVGHDLVLLLNKFIEHSKSFDPNQVNRNAFEQYSAYNITKILAKYLDMVIKSE